MNIITKFYIGMSDTNMKTQTVEPIEILDRAKDEFEGFTCYEAKGGWRGETENSMVVEVVGLSEERAMTLKNEFEEHFNQDSVMVVRTGADVTF